VPIYFTEKPKSGIDRHCRRANGFYSHDSDCNRFEEP